MDDADRWFGVFQGYRPAGEGVEAVFEGMPDAAEYAARIRAVCRAADHDDWARDAYFVVRRRRPAPSVDLIAAGHDLLSGLKLIAEIVARSGRPELKEYLGRVRQVEVGPPGTGDRGHDDHALVHEGVGDYLGSLDDDDHPAVRLREGFYSVACDYWLAWYLQWPYYRTWVERDVFRPYYELWASGCEVAFRGHSLVVARQG